MKIRNLAALWLIVMACNAPARAQSIEPRAYSAAPVGMNFLIVGYAESKGGLSVDPALPISNAKLSVDSLLLGYARAIDVFGRSGKIDVIAPYAKLSGSAIFRGDPVQRKVDGFFDPMVRLSVILHGAPAMRLAEFGKYRQDFLIGASVQVSVPIGQYDKTRLVNIGANRWSVKPEIGMSKVLGRWTLEVSAAATVYGDNKDFFGGRRRSQDPIFAAQTNVIYNFPRGIWAAAAATYFAGGKTSVDGIPDRNLQKNWRVGITTALPITRRISAKVNASTGVSARTGNNFDLFGLALQYRWGEGF